MHEFAVIGSGIGGSAIAAALHHAGHETVLFEKEPYLGGCASTFTHGGHRYNSGATTFAGYQEGHGVKTLFDAVDYTPELIESDPAIVIIQGEKQTPRYRDPDKFIAALQADYPHDKNRDFWHLIYEINQAFYAFSGHHYRNGNLWGKGISLLSFAPLFIRFRPYLMTNAYRYIHDYFGGVSDAYMAFMEAQILIVAQAKSREINFLTAALALGYTFNANHYVPGGMGKLFEGLTRVLPDVRAATPIAKIERDGRSYRLHTAAGDSVRAKNIILNTTVYDTPVLFRDDAIERYYRRYKRMDNHQSSFMLYLTLKTARRFHHHYQIIRDTPFVHTISNALFVSFSDPCDNTLTPEGYCSITASVHTDARWWEGSHSYRHMKQQLSSALLETVCATLDIDKNEVVHHVAATPKTFRHYLNRSQLGGNAMTMKNFLPRLPGNDTPFQGLYHVGDSVYAAQGWPGVMMGVNNLRRILNV